MKPTLKIPLFPLGVVALPGMPLPLHIFEERYKLMIAECLATDSCFGIVLFDGQSIRSKGCTAAVTDVLKRYDDGRMDILTKGRDRFVIRAITEEKPYLEAQVVYFDDTDADEPPPERLRKLVDRARDLLQAISDSAYIFESTDIRANTDAKDLSFAIPAMDAFTPVERQHFLEMTSSTRRLEKGLETLTKLVQRRRLTQEIQGIIGGNGHPPAGLFTQLIGSKE